MVGGPGDLGGQGGGEVDDAGVMTHAREARARTAVPA